MSYRSEQAFESGRTAVGRGDGDAVGDIDELRDRLDTVEDRIEKLAEDNAVTRTMAAMIDRDHADHRAARRGQTAVLNALRETQLEHGRKLTAHGRTLAKHTEVLAGLDRRLEGVDRRLEGVDRRLEGVDHHVQQMDGRIDRILRQVDRVVDHLGVAPPADGAPGAQPPDDTG